MPSIAAATPSPLSKMKRKREDASSYPDGSTKLPHQSRHLQTPSTSAPFFTSDDLTDQYQPPLERRPLHARPRRTHELKRQRVSIDHSHSFEQQQHDPLLSTREPLGYNVSNASERHLHDTAAADRVEAAREARPKINLNPCHICRRKPTARTELDQYDDCEGCGRRTCYICMRRCEGPGSVYGLRLGEGARYDVEGDYDVLDCSLHEGDGRMRDGREGMGRGYEGGHGLDKLGGVWEKGGVSEHRGKICSRCCVERGSEGETWCLGCLRTEE